MKIAHIVSGLPPAGGGLTVAVLEIARWQCLLGHDCEILTGHHRGPPADLSDIFCEAGGSLSEFSTLGSQKFRYMPQFRKYLEREGRDFDLYVLHGSYQYATYAAAQFCQHAKIPYVYTPHGSLDPAVRVKHRFRNRVVDFAYHDRVIQHASAWHFTSEEERTACERPIWANSFVEPLGVDVDRIPKEGPVGKFRTKYGIPKEAILLLFLSRITRKKGIDILLEAFRRLVKGSPNVFLALCGPIDQDMSELVQAALCDPEIASHLVATGLVLGEDKAAAFFDCNYFVLPTYQENFGIAAFEALAYGAPLITTTGMNLHAELVQNGRTMVVQPNADALYSGLLDVMHQRWEPSATRSEVRVWLEKNFSWRVRANNLTQRYLEAARGIPRR